MKNCIILCLLSLGLSGVSFSQESLVNEQGDTLTCFHDTGVVILQRKLIERREYKEIVGEQSVQLDLQAKTIAKQDSIQDKHEEEVSLLMQDVDKADEANEINREAFTVCDEELDKSKKLNWGLGILSIVLGIIVASK